MDWLEGYCQQAPAVLYEKHCLTKVKIAPGATMPTKAHDDDAGFDLTTIEDAILDPGTSKVIRTGVSLEIPHGWCALVYSRSGFGFHYDVSLANSVGVIDSTYRGEILLKLINHGTKSIVINRGDRIAQLLFSHVPHVTLEPAETLTTTERGEAGFGSTGR